MFTANYMEEVALVEAQLLGVIMIWFVIVKRFDNLKSAEPCMF